MVAPQGALKVIAVQNWSAVVPSQIIPVTRVNQDQFQSVIQFIENINRTMQSFCRRKKVSFSKCLPRLYLYFVPRLQISRPKLLSCRGETQLTETQVSPQQATPVCTRQALIRRMTTTCLLKPTAYPSLRMTSRLSTMMILTTWSTNLHMASTIQLTTHTHHPSVTLMLPQGLQRIFLTSRNFKRPIIAILSH